VLALVIEVALLAVREELYPVPTLPLGKLAALFQNGAGGAATDIEKLSVSDPPPLLAVRLKPYVPAVVGVPDTLNVPPEPEPLSPGGRLPEDKKKLLGLLDAETEPLYPTFTVPDGNDPLITGAGWAIAILKFSVSEPPALDAVTLKL
jgi:hypothetical protein